jgi:hypothetical protein
MEEQMNMAQEYEVVDAKGNRIMAGDTLRARFPAWHPQAAVLNGRLVTVRAFVTGRGRRDSGTIGVTSKDPVWNEFNRGMVYPGSWFVIVD